MENPYATAGGDDRQDVGVTIEGCAVDHDPRAPWNRQVISPGSRTCRVLLTWQRTPGDSRSITLDPAWTTTQMLHQSRHGHSASMLPNEGRILVAGGLGVGNTPRFTSELYDPETATFATGGTMNAGRGLHTATTLPDGRVLVTGGTSADQATAMASAEIYDGTTGIWTPTGSLTVARFSAAATLIQSKLQVLVTGGQTTDGGLPIPEIYDVATGLFSPAPAPLVHHGLPHTATLIPIDRVLVVGGQNGTTLDGQAEIYDSQSATWSQVSAIDPRHSFTATALGDGRVLFAGTCGLMGCAQLAPLQFFDITSQTVLPGATPPAPLFDQRAALLDSGLVLWVGGQDPQAGGVLPTTMTFQDPKAILAAPLSTPRIQHSLTALPGGRAVAIGGLSSTDTDAVALMDAEVFGPLPLGGPCSGPGDCINGICAKGVCCSTECTEPCFACSAAQTGASEGTCAPALSGTDPGNDCPDLSTDTCPRLVQCDGAGACQTTVPPKCQGLNCTEDSECATGFCTDGYCCDARCDGLCRECGGSDGADPGTCTAVHLGNDLIDECPADPAETVCGLPGYCDGNGACQTYEIAAICGPRRFGIGYRWDVIGVFYSAGVTGSATFDSSFERYFYYNGVVPIYGLGYTAAAPFSKTRSDPSVGSIQRDWIGGLSIDATALQIRVGYLGSKGLFTNLTQDKVRLFLTSLISDELKELTYFKSGVDRYTLLKEIGQSSLFFRKLAIPSPQTAVQGSADAFRAKERDAISFLTIHAEQSSIGELFDLRAAMAVAPAPFLHEASLGFHNGNYYVPPGTTGEESQKAGEGFRASLGYVRLPALPAMGADGAAKMTLSIEAKTTYGDAYSGIPMRIIIRRNDPDILATFPFARDAWNIYWAIGVGGI